MVVVIKWMEVILVCFFILLDIILFKEVYGVLLKE